MLAIFLLIFFIIFFFLFGNKALSKIQFGSYLEQFCFSIGVGLAFFSLLTFLLGILGLLYFWLFFLILVILVIVLFKEILIQSQALIKKIAQEITFSKADKTAFIIKIIIAIFILSAFVGSLSPPTGLDATTYHIAAPKLFIEQHRIFDIPYIAESFKPFNINMLYLFSMLLQGDLLANLINFLFYCLIIIAIFSFARKFFTQEMSLYAALIFTATPHAVFMSDYVNIDLGLSFFGFLSFYSSVNWLKSNDNKMLILASIFAGFCLGIDYIGIVFYILLIPCIIYKLIFLDQSLFSRKLAQLSLFIFISLCLGSPWYIRNYILTSNPVYPFMANIFGGRYIQTGNSTFEFFPRHTIGAFLAVLNQLRLYFHCKFNLGPYLFFIPCIVFIKKIDNLIKIIFCFGLLAFILIFAIVPLEFNAIKYLFPFTSLLSVVCAYIYVRLVIQDKSLEKILRLFVFLSAGITLLLFLGDVTYGLPVTLGWETKDSYYERTVDSYKMIKYINQNLDKESRILTVEMPQGYYLDRPFILWQWGYNYIDWKFLEDDKALLNRFRELGITHVVVLRDLDWLWRFFEENKGHFDYIHSAKNFYLYKINYKP